MKKTRRFAAIAAAAMMTAALAVPMSMTTFAAGEANITITDSQEDAAQNYSAYRLLNATVDSVADAYTYHLNPTYTTILQTATEKETEAEILEYIGGLNAADMRTFADKVYRAIKAANITAEATTTNGTIEDVAQGYYLIAQNVGDTGTASLVMVDTKGDTELKVETKKELPTFTKEIGDINDTTDNAPSATWNAADYTWGTDADHDKSASDAVPFRLTATLPADYANYEHYTLNFHDDLQADVFGEVTIKAVYVAKDDGTKIADITDYTKKAGCGVTHGSAHADGCDFTILIEDLKTACADAAAGDKVVVEYTAPFTTDTIVGSAGNWNTGLLEYSNNPYNSGFGENDDTHSKTPEENVVAFTYQTVIDKVDGKDQPLTGAEFTLKKVMKDGSKVDVAVVKAESGTTFTFEGLDDGNYVLEETVTPDGYNGIEPITFTVEPTHAEKALTNLNGTPVEGEIELTPTLAEGKLAAKVVNKSGSELPSTGGIGTTLFYVVGGALVAGAGVTLITKKRVKDSTK